MTELDEDERAIRQDDTPPSQPKKPRAKSTGRKTTGRRSTGARRGGKASLESTLKVELETVAMMWMASEHARDLALESAGVGARHGEKTCGEILHDQAGQIANALHVLSQDDARVYRFLSMASAGGGWGGVVFATLPVAQAMMFSHVLPSIQRRQQAVREASWPEDERLDEVPPEPYRGAHEARETEPEPEPFRPPNEIPPT